MGICEASCIAMIGGVIGGGLMAIANRNANKFNMETMEDHWNEDIYQLRGSCHLAHTKINEITQKLSTISVVKPVNSHVNKYKNNGYKHQRHF